MGTLPLLRAHAPSHPVTQVTLLSHQPMLPTPGSPNPFGLPLFHMTMSFTQFYTQSNESILSRLLDTLTALGKSY